jgi:lipoate-protein ligase A
LGVEAKFEGKTDIKVGGFKISGNAEHVYRNRVLHHGTLLFNSSLGILKNSIRKDKSCYLTRAVDSNPSSVMNLNEKLTIFNDIYEFREELMHYFLTNLPDIEVYILSVKEAEEALLLAETKYKSWEWNYAYGPEYIFKNSFQFDGKLHSCSLFVRDGIVINCTIEGSDKMISVAKTVTGCRHMVTDMLNVLKEAKINISEEDIFNFF